MLACWQLTIETAAESLLSPDENGRVFSGESGTGYRELKRYDSPKAWERYRLGVVGGECHIVCGRHRGPEDYVRSRGVSVEIVDDSECVRLMEEFIRSRPELWNEDIGV